MEKKLYVGGLSYSTALETLQNLFEKLTSLPLNFSINIDPEDLL